MSAWIFGFNLLEKSYVMLAEDFIEKLIPVHLAVCFTLGLVTSNYFYIIYPSAVFILASILANLAASKDYMDRYGFSEGLKSYFSKFYGDCLGPFFYAPLSALLFYFIGQGVRWVYLTYIAG